MKMKNVKQNRNKFSWVIGVVVFLCGWVVGYSAHFVIINWHSFFVTCPNGNRPDKHGCCDGEVYTDAGGGWMVCCPNDSDNCFPPIK